MTCSVEPAVGIDLGTTFSVLAHLDADGKPRTIRQRGRRTDHAERRVLRSRCADRRPGSLASGGIGAAAAGAVRQTRCRAAAVRQVDLRPSVSSGDHRVARVGEAQAGRRLEAGRIPQSGRHGARVFQRTPPEGHAGCRAIGRTGGDRHHQRTHGGGDRVRLGTAFSGRRPLGRHAPNAYWSTIWAAAHSM